MKYSVLVKKILTTLCLLFFFSYTESKAAEWQWSVTLNDVISNETGASPTAFLWIPPQCEQVRAVVVGQHNMSEEGILEHPVFRKAIGELGIAEIWITPGIDQKWDPELQTQEVFDKMMICLGKLSGYTELSFAPVIPIGHSAMATYPWNFGAFNPERTLAMLSIHGDSPRTHLTGYGRANLDWGNRTIEGIPGLMVMAEGEWWEDRLFTSFDYRKEYPDAPLSMLADAGRSHFDHSDWLIDYLVLFIKKAVEYRLLSDTASGIPAKLIPVRASDGWLAERWYQDIQPHYPAAPYYEYKGKKDSAFWYFDKEMAETTENYYTRVRGKKSQYIGFTQEGKLIEQNKKIRFLPEKDGVTFHLNATFTDSTHMNLTKDHARGKIKISRVCGPVEMLNDTTFRVCFYRMGLNNQKRTNDIALLAENDGNEEFKSVVQFINFRIPYRNTEGIPQKIKFDAIPDVTKKIKSMELTATTDQGLPVYYYVKEGPAEISERNKLIFTDLPPRTRYPVKITVVAWQYGTATELKYQTAEAVEQTFYIQ